jgi:precorrin-2 dehydrogenase/sirohydrochlorin ferrochelatase
VVAQGKVEKLVECGADVVVVSPTFTPQLEQWAAEGRIRRHAKAFEPADLDGIFLAIAATDDPAVNEQVAAEAKARGLLVNVVDAPDVGNFHAPATLRRGDLTIAISTGGGSPLLARHIREELETRYGPEYAAFVELLGELRPVVQERVPGYEARLQVWERMMKAGALDLLRAGERDAARDALIECIF